MKVDLIIKTAGQLVTCAANGKSKRLSDMSDVGIIRAGAVAVTDGKINAVGKADKIEKEFISRDIIDAGSRIVCPAFVDPHTHIVFAGNRLDEFELKIKGADYLEILNSGGGILSTVNQTREAGVEDLIEQSRSRLDKMLENGTCTAEVKTGYGLDVDTEMKMLKVLEELDRSHAIDLVPTFLGAHAIPPQFKDNTDGFVDLLCKEVLPNAWDWYIATHFFRKKIPFFADVFCERNAFDLRQSERILNRAMSLGFGIKAHVDEFTNLGGSRMAIGLGAVSVDHLDVISDDEIKLLAASETIGVVTPTVNFNFGSSKFADARKMIDEGCAIALSTDYNPGSAPCPSQLMAMAITCRYQKVLPSEALNAVTINAAFAVGLGKLTGSIEASKQADLLILDCDDYRQLAYEFGGNLVGTIVKKGEIVSKKQKRAC